MTLEQARFAYRVMHCLQQHPDECDPDVLRERNRIIVKYREYGRWTEGSERSLAEWLIAYIAQCDQPVAVTQQTSEPFTIESPAETEVDDEPDPFDNAV